MNSKQIIRSCFTVLFLLLVSCTSHSSNNNDDPIPTLITDYNYSQDELDLIQVINQYRVSIGKPVFQVVNHLSYKAMEHDEYMIANNVVAHDNFAERASNIILVFNAVKVGENLAYNYTSASSLLTAWLGSQEHRDNLDGDYTHFGLSVRAGTNGKRYVTNIFMKK